MRWKKLGIVWKPQGTQSWARSHAMCPTPHLLRPGVIRVFVTCLDDRGRGRPGFIDVAADDPRCVLRACDEAILNVGDQGTFDDNGLVALSIVSPAPGRLLMYYAGFELCTQVRYRILTGVAVSTDDGETFARTSRVPVLERSDAELYFRGGPYAMLDEGRFKLWYVAGSEWITLAGKAMPMYDLRYQESADGLTWSDKGRVSMRITGDDEHGFGRPWVVKRGPRDYRLFYSIRRRSLSAYRLGYAESMDGVHWVRKDNEMNLDVTPGSFDSDAIMYCAVVTAGARTYCFYNGNDFGRDGFAVSELVE